MKTNKYRSWKHDATKSASRRKVKRLANKVDRRTARVSRYDHKQGPQEER